MTSKSAGLRSTERLQRRLDHLARLGDPGHGQTVEQASTSFAKLYNASPRPDYIVLRRRFVRRSKWVAVASDRDKSSRVKPPAQKLIESRGVAYRLYLILLAAAQCRPAGRPANSLVRIPISSDDANAVSLIDLIAPGTQRGKRLAYQKPLSQMRAEQVRNALDLLAGPDLVLVDQGDPDLLRLNMEFGPRDDQDPRPWKMPPATTRSIHIPIEFFLNGWVHVLTDSELAAWLMFRDYSGITHAEDESAPFTLFAAERLSWYDQSKDVWDTHSMLSKMGLMTSETSPYQPATGARSPRRDGTVFRITDQGLNDPALAAALAAVAEARDEAAARAS